MALDADNPRLTQSEYDAFDFVYAEKLKKDYPTIWKAGGNIRGNQAFQYYAKYRNGDRGDGVLKWLKEREAWCARHFQDGKQFKGDTNPSLSNIAGVVAQVKWGCVGTLGENKMKDVINTVKDKVDAQAASALDIKAEGGVEVVLSGEVGSWKVSAAQIAQAIEDKPNDPLVVKINSVGGDVFEGFALYNAIRYHSGHTTAIVEGIAASAASLFAMAADKVVMRQASMMMVHNPWMMTGGESKDLRSAADTLDKIKDIMVSRYAEKTGLGEEQLSQILDEETWLTPHEALELGFADQVDETEKSVEVVQDSIITQFKSMFKTKSQVIAALTADEIKAVAATLDTEAKIDLIKSLADNLEGVGEVCVKMDGEEKYMSSPEVAVVPMDDHAMILALGVLEVRDAAEAGHDEEEAGMDEEEAGYDEKKKSEEEEEMKSYEEKDKEGKEKEKAEEDEEEKMKSELETLTTAIASLTEQINDLKEERAADIVSASKRETKPSWKEMVIANAVNQKTK